MRGTQHNVFLDEPFTRAGQGPTNLQSPADPPHPYPLPEGEGAKALDRLLRGAAAADARGAVLRMRLEGARTAAPVTGRERLPGTVNYLKGRDPAGWRTGVATYGRVEYRGVYPGIDLVYYGNQRQLEYDFVVAPGADPNQIRLSFGGVDPAAAPRLEASGDLRLPTAAGEVRLRKPVVYQDIDGRRRTVEGRFVMLPPAVSAVQAASPAQVGFQVGDYDPTRPLVIDPVLAYSTYLGGSYNSYGTGGEDFGRSIAVDGAGKAYVTGDTESSDFPQAYDHFRGSRDAFVIKLSADGQTLLDSTYFGGSGWDHGTSIAVDGAGNAYVTGDTDSSDFPAVNAKYPGLRGDVDAFVFKLSTDGEGVFYSTYLGGSDRDGGRDIKIDGAGNAYVTGSTRSSDFPRVNAKYPNWRGGYDAFVFKLSADGQTVRYSTYLGGGNEDGGSGIALDGAGNVHVTGQTGSSDFPTVNAKYPELRASSDAFVFKLSADGQTVRYSTYFGGSDWEIGYGIAVDGAGNAYVTGLTDSSDFPTVNARYPRLWGYRDAFVFKLSADGQTVRYSTYLGGSGDDRGFDIAVDGAGNAYVTGGTRSSDFPVVNALDPNFGGSGYFDAFVFKLSADGQTVRYSTYLGGGEGDGGSGIAVDGVGNAYVTGYTDSSDFPTSAKDPNIISYDSTYNGDGDAVIAKLNDTGTLHPPLDNQSPSLMKGRVRGECVFGGYCARKTAASAHNALDYAFLAGTPVYAICNGKVKIARTQATTPVIDNRFTIIDHSRNCGYSSLWAYYGHIDPTVAAGQAVKMGDKIGVIADWGSNSHLHLAINSAYKSSGWGYVNVGENISKDCNKTSVVRRRDLLAQQGWIDPAILGASAGWKPFLLQGGAPAPGIAMLPRNPTSPRRWVSPCPITLGKRHSGQPVGRAAG